MFFQVAVRTRFFFLILLTHFINIKGVSQLKVFLNTFLWKWVFTKFEIYGSLRIDICMNPAANFENLSGPRTVAIDAFQQFMILWFVNNKKTLALSPPHNPVSFIHPCLIPIKYVFQTRFRPRPKCNLDFLILDIRISIC